jgi:hypothetical protein
LDKDANNVAFRIEASDKSPLVNPAFVIPGWGHKHIELEINGKEVKRGNDFRHGKTEKLNGSDLVIWIQFESTETVQILFRVKE